MVVELRQLLFRTKFGLTYRMVFFVDGEIVYVARIRGPAEAAGQARNTAESVTVFMPRVTGGGLMPETQRRRFANGAVGTTGARVRSSAHFDQAIEAGSSCDLPINRLRSA